MNLVCKVKKLENEKKTSKYVVNDVGEKVGYKYGEIEVEMSIFMDDISVAGGSKEVKKRNNEMCKNGSGKENEIQFKPNKVHDSNDRVRKGRRNFITRETREHSKNQKIEILRNHNK